MERKLNTDGVIDERNIYMKSKAIASFGTLVEDDKMVGDGEL